MDPLVAAAAIAAIPSTIAAVASLRANQKGKANAGRLDEHGKTLEETKRTVEKVEKETNGQLTEKIRQAVRDELITHSDNTEAIRDLLDGLIMAAAATEEENPNG